MSSACRSPISGARVCLKVTFGLRSATNSRRTGMLVHVRLCRQHSPRPGIGGRRFGPAVGPSLEIIDGVHDSTADLPIGGACTVGSMFFEGPSGQAEKTCSFRRSQKARRQAGGRIGHADGSVVVTRAVERRRRNDGHGGGDSRAGRMTNSLLRLAIPPSLVSAKLTTGAQQLSIAAVHHGHGIGDQSDRLAPDR